ncbi:CU044_2847 family protein [Streptomyces sp. NPDC050161]|uniref:CU044_2847 family protein n=1 Tax=Streptomyces sp. NPDC050161 TaxID=3365604 RepID=UPI0037A60EA5
MDRQVVAYALDDGTHVGFEIEPPPGFQPAGRLGERAGEVRAAVAPAVRAAQEVLSQVRAAGRPDEVQVKFGVKVSGGTTWLIAAANSEVAFEITLTWKSEEPTARS